MACRTGHLDAASLHTDGQREGGEEPEVVRVTQGYSRDHRPDLNQVVAQFICENEAGIPLFKDPLFLASTLFLKSPKRLIALLMVMTLRLLVYAAIE